MTSNLTLRPGPLPAKGFECPKSIAETLAGALIKAYQASPLLDANEAALRSLDECVPQTRAERCSKGDVSVGASSQATADPRRACAQDWRDTRCDGAPSPRAGAMA